MRQNLRSASGLTPAERKDNPEPSPRIGSPVGAYECSPPSYFHRTAQPSKSGTRIVPQLVVGLRLSWPPFVNSRFRGLWAWLSPCRPPAYELSLVLSASPFLPCQGFEDRLIQPTCDSSTSISTVAGGPPEVSLSTSSVTRMDIKSFYYPYIGLGIFQHPFRLSPLNTATTTSFNACPHNHNGSVNPHQGSLFGPDQ